MLRVHLIAIGGSIMHNLAISLHNKGYQVSGSDDLIFEPARSRLAKIGILPNSEGWDARRIDTGINLIILGMHAKRNNPELRKALELGIPVQSFPEFISQQYRLKKQIVITGSHGKTTTSAMMLHVLNRCNVDADYLVGAQLEGFDNMVSITNAPIAVIEGDEYLSSCLDPRPKFVHYQSFIHIITGIAWDHYNVFPSYALYKKAFEDCISGLQAGTHLVYYKNDVDLENIVRQFGQHLIRHPYSESTYVFKNDRANLILGETEFPLEVFGRHNLQNIEAVLQASAIMGLDLIAAANALTSFKGASKRMELIANSDSHLIYRDFAHAPSKVSATIDAFRERFPDKKILVILELHTYSSLNKEFLPQYKNTVDSADRVVIYLDAKAMELKNMEFLENETIHSGFQNQHIIITRNKAELLHDISILKNEFEIIIFMGSGHFGGIDLMNLQ